MTTNPALRIAAPVQEALASGTPVVALESTIFTHGLPRPPQRRGRAGWRGDHSRGRWRAGHDRRGARPAGGRPDRRRDQRARLRRQRDEGLDPRPVVRSSHEKEDAGTTIAATALLAHAAGIDVFATGGLGGVHHGAAQSFDESADIFALAEIPIVLVSSGAKAILDIRATLERFESLSIPVVGYRTNTYPGFYVAESEYALTARVDDPADVATMVTAQKGLGVRSAVLVANPVPVDEQLDPTELDAVLQRAWAAADEQGISGQASTRSCSTTSGWPPTDVASTRTSPSTTTTSGWPCGSPPSWRGRDAWNHRRRRPGRGRLAVGGGARGHRHQVRGADAPRRLGGQRGRVRRAALSHPVHRLRR